MVHSQHQNYSYTFVRLNRCPSFKRIGVAVVEPDQRAYCTFEQKVSWFLAGLTEELYLVYRAVRIRFLYQLELFFKSSAESALDRFVIPLIGFFSAWF